MAITKLLRIKESRQGQNRSLGLRRCVDYICNPKKTENGKLITGNCGVWPELIYEQMKANKETWGKPDGSQGFHYVLSFPPDEEIDEKLTMQIAQEFCEELLHDRYLYVIAVHNDKDHLHAHIVFDSVSKEDGYMFHSGQYDWKERIQPITDRICEKHGLRTLQYDPNKERTGKYHTEWEAEKNTAKFPKKDVSWNDLIRDDIERALENAKDWNELLQRLKEMHYEIKDGKYLSVRPYGKERFVRTARLGPEYTKERLQERIYGEKKRVENNNQNSSHTYGRQDIPFRACRRRLQEPWHRDFSPMQKEFYRKWMALSFIRKPDFRNGWKYKKEVIRLGKLTDELDYMFQHDLTNSISIQEHIIELNQIIAEKERDRRRISNRLAGIDDETVRNHLAEENAGISEELRSLRKELKLCRSLISDSADISVLQEDGAYRAEIPTQSSFHRITVNQVLFENLEYDTDYSLIRIPGHPEEYILLYRDDSRLLNEGKMLSSYLYDDLDYMLTDKEGNVLRRISGKEALQFFTDRTQKRESVSDRNRKSI